MPIYEYQCRDCRKRSARLILSLRNQEPVSCTHCGSAHVDRLLSCFAAPKSEVSRLEALADPGNLGGLDESDPASMARFMKNMGDEMGENVGADIDAMMDQSEGRSDASAGIDSQ